MRFGEGEGRLPAPRYQSQVGSGPEPQAGPMDSPSQETDATPVAIPKAAQNAGARADVGDSMAIERDHIVERRTRRLRAAALARVAPRAARLAVLSDGDDQELRLTRPYLTSHFPDGASTSKPSGDVASTTGAIANLEWLRTQGTQFLVIPRSRSGQLENWPGFAAHLARYELVDETGEASVYALDKVAPREARSSQVDLKSETDRLWFALDRSPTVLDLTDRPWHQVRVSRRSSSIVPS